jgi:3-methyladenine DNA glycosylase AlkD
MDYQNILRELRSKSNPKNVQGMAMFGINPENTLGISIPVLRKMAKDIGRNHKLAQELWTSGVHEARLLAGFIDNAVDVTVEQMDSWVKDFDSWDVCDQVCSNLFDKTPFAYAKAKEWSSEKEEFVKRAGFVLMAALAVHDKKADDKMFTQFLPIIKKQATDDRNFVKKAVNWALRQIGKRNATLQKQALKTAEEILAIDNKSAKWIASDAIRELKSRYLE